MRAKQSALDKLESRGIVISWLRFAVMMTALMVVTFCLLSSCPVAWTATIIVVLIASEIFFFAAEQTFLAHTVSIPVALCEELESGAFHAYDQHVLESISDNPVLSRLVKSQFLLHEATLREHLIADFGTDVVLGLSDSLIITAINHSCQKYLKYGRSELLGRCILELLGEGQTEFQQVLVEASCSGKAQSVELRMIRGDKKDIYVDCQVERSATHSTYYCTLTDITERKLYELSRKEFVAMISHDLRVPLGNVMMTLEMIEEFELSSMTLRSKSLMKDCRQNVSRLLSLTEQLLDLERHDAGRFAVTTEIHDVEGIVKAAVQNIESFARSRDIGLEVLSEDLLVWADHVRVIQVLINLLSNAVKFSPPGSIVRMSVGDIGNNEIEFRITNDGVGIPLAEQGKVFQRFLQIEGSQKKVVEKSIGLGLVICKMLVESHGGRIGFESAEGQGASFWFVLRSAGE